MEKRNILGGYLRKLRYPIILILVVGVSFLMLHNSKKETVLKEETQENMLAIYLEDEPINYIPDKESGYTLDLEKSNCTNEVSISWDDTTWSARLDYTNYTYSDNSRVRCSLYFKWNKTTLTVNPNGGSWNGTSEISSFEKLNGTRDVIQEPTRDGYDFRGWEIQGGTSLYNYGTSLYTDESFQNGLNYIEAYNNLHNGTVTVERVQSSSDNPIKDSDYMLKITTTGAATPDLGGFHQTFDSRLLGTFYHVFIAKIPVGYSLSYHTNPVGENSSHTWLTPTVGTGEWETYIYRVDCGTSGTFSNFAHLALTSISGEVDYPLTWYLAYSTLLDASAGVSLYNDTTFLDGMNSMSYYNNLHNDTVILNRVSRSDDNPLLNSDYMIEIKNIGDATPGLGGFHQSTYTVAGGVYYHLIYAKIPEGYYMNCYNNDIGDDFKIMWLTSNWGTGRWEKYIYRLEAGTTGTFENFAHIAIHGSYGTPENPVIWYVGYANVFDATNLDGNFSTYVYEYQTNSTITAKWVLNPE